MIYYSKTSSGKKHILMECYLYQMVLPRDKQWKTKFELLCYSSCTKVKGTTNSKRLLEDNRYLSVTEQYLKD